jgi:hypothetical protein
MAVFVIVEVCGGIVAAAVPENFVFDGAGGELIPAGIVDFRLSEGGVTIVLIVID